MHSPERYDYDSLRSGLWLVLDLIDDVLEFADVRERHGRALHEIRANVVDVLFDVRHLEDRRRSPDPAA